MSFASPTSPSTSMPAPPLILVMGPAGSGKTHIGTELATALGVRFVDADSMHSTAARAKMARGDGLTDTDRAPWLERVAGLFDSAAGSGAGVVVACSALKRAYRDAFRATCADIVTIELDVPAELLAERIRARSSHFVTVDLLPSQLADLQPLEPDERGFRLDATPLTDVVVSTAISRLHEFGIH